MEGPVNDYSEGALDDSPPHVMEQQHHHRNYHNNHSNSLPPTVKKDRTSSVFERRRRRFKNKELRESNGSHSSNGGGGGGSGSLDKSTSSTDKQSRKSLIRFSKKKTEDLEDEDVDPYDSDPGESYREHCMNMKGLSTKTCMPVPNFLRNASPRLKNGEESETVLTAPPSPMASEMGDMLFGQTPASLPTTLSRVRYSLRSSITDGSEKQPSGPSVMDRRELRPNDIHINVSHWSDEGGRPYMEDR